MTEDLNMISVILVKIKRTDKRQAEQILKSTFTIIKWYLNATQLDFIAGI